MKNILLSLPRISFHKFWIVLAIVYAVIFETIEFSDSPVSGIGGYAVILSQWLVVSLFASSVIGLMSLSRWFFIIVFPLFMLLSTIMAYYTVTMGVHLTGSIIELMAVNDVSVWSTVVSFSLVAVSALSIAAGVAIGLYRFYRVNTPRYAWLWGVIFLAIMLTPLYILKQFQGPVTGRVPYAFWSSCKEYYANRYDIENDQRTTFDQVVVERDSVSPTVVFVIGESLRPDHLQINGYDRPTTPLLASDTAVVSLPNVTSRETFTHLSVPYIMTRSDHDNDDRRWTEQSFITLFKRAGYHTSWLSNQDRCPNYFYFMNEADTLIMVSPQNSLYSFGKILDADVLPHLDKELSRHSGPQLIVIHSIGSHWWYPSHYSEASARFKPEVDSRVLSDLSHEQIVNSYDNTIVETDKFLHAITRRLAGMNAIMIYISDHGESLGEDGEYFHKKGLPSTYSTASLIWYSEEYERNWPEKIQALRANQHLEFDTDVYFHSVIDAASLQTPVMDTAKSIFRQ